MEKLVVIKIGGQVLDDNKATDRFLAQFTKIEGYKLLVHGGGKLASRIGKKLGIEPDYINGRRITDAATLNLVTMVYAGLINKTLVAKLQALGCNAIGLTGADANLIHAVKRPVADIDYGLVGDIASSGVAAETAITFLKNDLVPVLAPLTHDGEGQLLNTNADTIASAVAVALSGSFDTRLIYCFEKKGVLENIHDEDSVLHLIDRSTYKQLLDTGKLADGILPKIDNAFAAIDQGVTEVLIGRADDLLENCSNQVKGTLVKK